MTLKISSMRVGTHLAEASVFVSASIPDPTRWPGEFDALAITDAVTATARAILTQSGTIVTAAHPTIAPLLLYVAGEFPSTDRPSVVVYQSRLFEGMLPEATTRFEREGVGMIQWTEAVTGDAPTPGRWDRSLRLMRVTMLRDSAPVAAIFVGGMEGIIEEHALFREMYPRRPWYALGRPGGMARNLTLDRGASLRDLLEHGEVYPALVRAIIRDIAESGPAA